MSLKTSFASILRTVRSKRNISQRDFGSTASRTYLSKLESARCSITLDKLEQISQRLELNPLTLLTLTLSEESGKSAVDLIRQVESEIHALSWEQGEQALASEQPEALRGLGRHYAAQTSCAIQTEITFPAY